MADYELSDDTRAKLMKVSTASVATALFKRGLRHQFIQGVARVSHKTANMVGQAFTLRYIPAREDRNPITVFRDPHHPQRQAMEQCPPGHVLVMDARKDTRAATAGSILITRLAIRGQQASSPTAGSGTVKELANWKCPPTAPIRRHLRT